VSFSVGAGFMTVTVIEGFPSTVLLAANAVAEIVCAPLAALAVSQVTVEGGVLAK